MPLKRSVTAHDTEVRKKRGKDMSKLREPIELLLAGQALPRKFNDHALRGADCEHRYMLFGHLSLLVDNCAKTRKRIFDNKFRYSLYALRPARLKVKHANLIDQGNTVGFRAGPTQRCGETGMPGKSPPCVIGATNTTPKALNALAESASAGRMPLCS